MRQKKRGMWWFIGMVTVVLGWYLPACSYPKEKLQEFQKEVARQAAEPKTPEERCRRQGGVMNGEQCYTPSEVVLDERTCRMRGGLYLNEQCLMVSLGKSSGR
jgi:hypothetical protein